MNPRAAHNRHVMNPRTAHDHHLVDADDHLARLVENTLVAPVCMVGFNHLGPVVVVAEPQDTKRQQKRVFVATGVT